jgi:hypothetical protein
VKGIGSNRNYIRVRGVLGVLYVLLGVVIAGQLLARGLRFETVVGLIFGAAMIALGILRVRAAWGRPGPGA